MRNIDFQGATCLTIFVSGGAITVHCKNILSSVSPSSDTHLMPLPLDPAGTKIRTIFLKSNSNLQASCGLLRKVSKLHFFL